MRSVRICSFSFAIALLALACSSSGGSGSSEEDKKVSDVIGIDPIGYKCEYLVSLEQVTDALGGKVKVNQVAFEPPPGVAEPCHYTRKEGDTLESWSFDLDCRADALKDANALFKQYQVQKMNDAGAITNDTSDLQIGRRAMDHHGQALIFIDDDTDCYVRVLGPSQERRIALGKLLAKKLVIENVPMRPRPRKARRRR